ncbi:MAG: hypothetical protein GX982_07645 [Tissierellia bacterium]|nr:hypothetical protein [Tissierellia bacterium]
MDVKKAIKYFDGYGSPYDDLVIQALKKLALSDLNWDEADKYLAECERAYLEIGSAGYLGFMVVIKPLRDRFNDGERTQELYDEIFELTL